MPQENTCASASRTDRATHVQNTAYRSTTNDRLQDRREEEKKHFRFNCEMKSKLNDRRKNRANSFEIEVDLAVS